MSNLPPGWMQVKLADVASTQLGRMLSSRRETGAYARPYLRNRDVQWGHINVSDLPNMDFSPKDADRFRLTPGDVLVCEGGEVGRAAIWKDQIAECYFQKAIHRVQTSEALSPEFLRYLLEHYARSKAFASFTSGSTIAHLPQEDLRNLPINLPSRAEQERIVTAIEEQFSRLDAGVAALTRAGQNLGRMRAAVLQAAVTGILVLAENSMPIKPLSEAVSFLDQGWSPRCENTPAEDNEHWGVIKTTAVQAMHFDEGANKRLPDGLSPRPGYELMSGDLLITRAGPRARVGICCLVRNVRPRLMICDKVYRFRANVTVALPEYLELVLNAPSVTIRINELKTGISDSGVNITQQNFRELEIALPSLEMQKKIIATVEHRLTIMDALEAYLATAMIRARQLRSSVLASAFSGKLVSQDPYGEAASVFLTRTDAEQGTSNGGGTAPTPQHSNIPKKARA